ncbi:hypothetical protein QFC19_001223 [Naganishia cerealis]|uniref:Uncharacterized protein n=1 Tax=Naganishia cerealis TaxID=610337 RepID=A0ACC2WJR2_9TREE|nr:hypothetical protein QFC19_001223 [Naganishia cerealis]
MSDSVNIVLQEGFIVTDIDKEGKKFDKAMEVTLDYASELISFRRSEKISICLARSLQSDPISSLSDGAKEGKREMWRGGEQGLAEEFDYVMYGKTNFGLRLAYGTRDAISCKINGLLASIGDLV